MKFDESSTIDQIKQKILLDLFITPWSLFPFIGGVSLLILAWATKVYGLLAFGGFLGVVFGIGTALTNCVFNLDKFSMQAVEYLKNAKMLEREKRLNLLANKLAKTREQKDDNCLDALRSMYSKFLVDLEDGKLDVYPEMIAQVEQIFEECINTLEHSYELYKTVKTMPRGQKQAIHDKRKELLDEVDASVELLSDMMVKIRTMNTQEKSIRLSKMREELEMQLRAAENTNNKMIELEHGNSSEDYSEYLRE